MNTIRSYLERASTRADEAWLAAHRTLSIWIFGDLIYAVLPLLVLAAITMLLGQSFEGFLNIKEWSFATIVFFGVSIRDLVRLKVRIQQTPNSYKLDSGVQLFVVLLIASVLVLALVILSEKNVLPKGHEYLLGFSQVLLFFLGGISVLAGVQAREIAINWKERATASPTQWKLRYINRELSNTEEMLSYLADAIAKFSRQPSARLEDDSGLHEEKRAAAIAFGALERISAVAKGIESDLKGFLDGNSRGEATRRQS
jgi:hypothetical protein